MMKTKKTPKNLAPRPSMGLEQLDTTWMGWPIHGLSHGTASLNRPMDDYRVCPGRDPDGTWWKTTPDLQRKRRLNSSGSIFGSQTPGLSLKKQANKANTLVFSSDPKLDRKVSSCQESMSWKPLLFFVGHGVSTISGSVDMLTPKTIPSSNY